MLQLSVGDTTQIVVAMLQLIAVCAAILQFRTENRHRADERREADALHAENAAAQLSARRIEIYQRLEIESNRVFEFEARHPQLVPMMKRRLAPAASLGDLVVQNEYGDRMDARQIAMIARKYYEMNCNLFEIASRLRKLELVDHDVFGSWAAWYFDTATEWGFRALWHDLRDNYTADLRAIFDPICISLIDKWDVPHSRNALDPIVVGPDGLADVPADAVEAERTAFYAYMADSFDCQQIRGWLQRVKDTALPIEHPLAYS